MTRNTIRNRIQLLHPSLQRWIKIDARTGRILRTKRSAGPWAVIAIAATLAACTAQQIATVQVDQAKIEAAIAEGCGYANLAASVAAPFAAVPQVAGVLTFITAGCGTAQAVAALTTRAVNDPSTIAWVTQLSATLRAAVAQVRGR